jgi:ubiquinone/menaquinone biosynthesis C-methylase UbiE
MSFVFDKYYKKYDDWFDKNEYIYLSELIAIRKVLPMKGKGLEVGVGTGRFASALGIKTGIEPSLKMALMAKERGVEVFPTKAENLPFSDSSFDFVLIVTTICFFDDIETAFKEVHRVLKAKGQLIIGFVDKNSFLGKVYQQKKEQSVFYNKATFYSTEEVLVYLKKIGFSDFSFFQTVFNASAKINRIDAVEVGYGKGSFVVINSKKKEEK